MVERTTLVERAAEFFKPDFSKLTLAQLRNAPGYQDFTFAPQLNENSLKIADGMKRSASADYRRRARDRDRILAEALKDMTFKPAINRDRKWIGGAESFPAVPSPVLAPASAATAAVLVPVAPGRPPTRFPALPRLPKPEASEIPSRLDKLAVGSVVGNGPSAAALAGGTANAAVPAPPHRGVTSAHPLSAAVADVTANDSAAVPPLPAFRRRRHRRRAVSPSTTDAPLCTCTNASCLKHSSPKSFVPRPPPRLTPEQEEHSERTKRARETVSAAVRAGKIFTMTGDYMPLREGLEARGWIERRLLPDRVDHRYGLRAPRPDGGPAGGDSKSGADAAGEGDNDGDDVGDDPDDGHHAEPLPDQDPYLARALVDSAPNLLFLVSRSILDLPTLKPEQYLNHFLKTSLLVTKTGLTRALRDTRWVDDVDVDAFYPRCFDLNQHEDLSAFIDEFRLTAARNIVQKHAEWHVPAAVLDLALRVCEQEVYFRGEGFLGGAEGEDGADTAAADLRPVEWEVLLQFSYSPFAPMPLASVPPPKRDLAAPRRLSVSADDVGGVAGGRDGAPTALGGYDAHALATAEQGAALLASLLATAAPPSPAHSARGKAVLDFFARRDPQFRVAGFHNLWVVKPGAKSRGRGIFCENRLDYILQANSSGDDSEQYVAQKYLEVPLLIHDTKFDIRQWFLVTSFNPLTIWMYKKAYLRFSSQPFSLDEIRSDKAKSVHLCNNAIQMHEEGYDAMAWAKGNQWTSDEFCAYLADEGHGSVWAEAVYPQMTAIIATACKASQDHVMPRRNCFELFGADFVLDRSFQPWLLEINTSPSMCRNTPTCAKLVPEVLDDVLKVVFDRRLDKTASTGAFELVVKTTEAKIPMNVPKATSKLS